MNKFLVTMAVCLTAVTAVAQEDNENRMVVHQKGNVTKVYDIAGVDSITFDNVSSSGEATLAITAQAGTKALVSVTLPDGCKKCDIALVPDDGSVADLSAYIKRSHQHRISYSTTVTLGQMETSAKYIVAAQTYDKYGLPMAITALPLVLGNGDVTDLGEGANCYIVPEKGKYSFVPRHVRGDMIANIAKVDWIWCTKSGYSSDQNMLSNIAYDANGRVSFEATGKKGNVVLAAFDSNNRVVWTWLIWCTDRPKTMQYENGAEFMDRFLGATSADPADGNSTWGLLWQWGRPTPFFAGYDENEWEVADAFSEAKKWTIVNSSYDFEWGFKGEGVSMSDAIAAPLTFFDDDETCDWHNTSDLTLWGEQKTDYDPSPAGYRMPVTSEWEEFANGLVYSSRNLGFTYTYNGNEAWWPALGSGREFNTGCNIISTGKMFVWSATSKWLNDVIFNQDNAPTAYRLVGESSTVYTETMGNRAFAHAVRCVVDK